MKEIFTLLFCFTLLCANPLFAQDSTAVENSINHQFDLLMKNSNNYKQYEVVRTAELVQLQKNTQEEISNLENEITTNKTRINEQKKEISELKNSLSKSEENLQHATQSKAEIAFLGIPMEKNLYRTITWGIIVLLAIALFVFIYKFKNSHVQTREAQRNLNDLEIEFDEYRKTALEKQQKLGRMLQDERNKAVKPGPK
ncbi:MAG TPA: hypothetical protein VFM82_08475 [Flavobacteriaceae bacterium]|nr:hypothetical protein [Flavobacteriaceae bacterium]